MPAREARHMEHCYSTLQSRVHGDCHNQYTRGLSQPIVQGDDHNHVYTGIVTNKCTWDCHNQCTWELSQLVYAGIVTTSIHEDCHNQCTWGLSTTKCTQGLSQPSVHGDCHKQCTRGLSQPVYTGIVTTGVHGDCHNQCTEGFVDVLVKLRCSANNHRHFKPCIITSRFSSQMFMCKFTNVR